MTRALEWISAPGAAAESGSGSAAAGLSAPLPPSPPSPQPAPESAAPPRTADAQAAVVGLHLVQGHGAALDLSGGGAAEHALAGVLAPSAPAAVGHKSPRTPSPPPRPPASHPPRTWQAPVRLRLRLLVPPPPAPRLEPEPELPSPPLLAAWSCCESQSQSVAAQRCDMVDSRAAGAVPPAAPRGCGGGTWLVCVARGWSTPPRRAVV